MKLLDTIFRRNKKPVQQLVQQEEVPETISMETATEVFTSLLKNVDRQPEDTGATLPTRGGRSSVSTDDSVSWAGLLNELGMSQPDFPEACFNVLENLAIYNADLSYAIDNIVQLGNTEYKIVFDEVTSAQQKEQMQKYIANRQREWYAYSDGINGLITDLMAQIAMTGALSAEIVPLKDISGVDQIVLVNPKQIRFLYDSKVGKYWPYQKVPGGVWTKILATSGMKKLNTETYRYIALRRLNDKPYAIPPFLSAFENISIEKDMICNLKTIVKRLGMLGFLQVLLTAPKMKPNEELEAYQIRMKSYLENQVPEMNKGLNSGLVMGFKGSHEFSVQSTMVHTEGAKGLFELNAQMKMSGLKQDPLMLGRNFSTTETIGRVILTKLSTQVVNYQKIIAAFLSDVFFMELQLGGFDVKYVACEFEKPMVGDKLKDEEAFSARIDNYDKLYIQGVVSQTVRAQALGWEKADKEKPREPSKLAAPKPKPAGNGVTADTAGAKTSPYSQNGIH